jgi:hypothetical protein
MKEIKVTVNQTVAYLYFLTKKSPYLQYIFSRVGIGLEKHRALTNLEYDSLLTYNVVCIYFLEE